AIHYASARRDGDFVTFKAAATPPGLIDSELVGSRGHRGGHLARAVGGTLLVKDIVEVPRGPQRKLARIVRKARVRGAHDETGAAGTGGAAADSLDVRLLTATDVDPETAVENGLLDRELYDRIGARRIEMPPLRKRPDDIPQLVMTFVRHFAEE